MPTTKPKASKKPNAKKSAAKKTVAKKVVAKKVAAKKTKPKTRKPRVLKPKTKKQKPIVQEVTSVPAAIQEPVIAPVHAEHIEQQVLLEPVTKRNKTMLWLTVGSVTLVIGILWLYSLQFTLPNISNSGPTFTEANPQVDEFVDTVEEDWSDFQVNVDEFENLIDDELTDANTNSTQPKSKVAPAGEATTDELNNLFSDIN